MTNPIHIISLGAGVQSSTMALMAAAGEITPMPTCAIFADTQAEPASVYRWLDWLETQLPFPVHRVTAGSLTEDSLRIGFRKSDDRPWLKGHIPAFIRTPGGGASPLWRTCTMDFKVRPLLREARKICGVKRLSAIRCIMWIGISLDEVHRMKPSREKWAKNIWPLIDKRMSRVSCLRWMKERGFPEPPRSSCTYCPFHSDAEWKRLKESEPEDFEKAVDFERRLQAASIEAKCHQGRITLHRSGKNISDVDFDPSATSGQGDLFGNECEGMCGI